MGTLTLAEDAMFNTRVDLASEVERSLVFVGYGLRVPEKNYDDLAGLDMKGKIAVLFSGSPSVMPTALASHYQSFEERTRVMNKEVDSANVIGRLPGSDPKLKEEYVVLSAHMDHLGVGEPIKGDRIYNGAMDNASGCAVMPDLADSLTRSKAKLKRSLLLVFVTAEEKGLLGSKYFTKRPTVPPASLVADINTDMFLPLFPLKLLTVYGLAESDLGEMVRGVAMQENVDVEPDPEPLRNIFIRSDQYNFIKLGIPSLAMRVGYERGSVQEAAAKAWLTDRYHVPSDDAQQPVDLAAAGKFEEIVRDLTTRVANADHRPEWKPDSFFRRFAPKNLPHPQP